MSDASEQFKNGTCIMTIFGKHTLDETRDLLAVADYRFKETGKAYDVLSTKPADLTHDWETLSAKWSKDRVRFRNLLLAAAFNNVLLPASAIATEDEYKQILDYIQFQENVKGSLQDITYRIGQLRGKPLLYENQPGQTTTDIDLDLFKELDKKTKEMDAAADAAKKGAKDAAFSNWGLMVGGTVLVTLVGTQILKRYL